MTSVRTGPAAGILAGDYRDCVYWWDQTKAPEADPGPPPAETDVVVVGSGYTGLCAALQTARAGRATAVLEAGRLGRGCSTRNGGQVTNLLKPPFANLARRYGPEQALAILREGRNSMTFLREFINAESIDCDLRPNGKFRAAHNAAQYEAMARGYASQISGLELEVDMVPRSEQRREIGSDAYHGGAVIHAHFALDPARYHRGLANRARAAGAQLFDHCAVKRIERDGRRHVVTTARGVLKSRDVVIATGGYTGRMLPWLRRRVIPIGSYMIATEPLPAELVREIIPNDRIVTDTRRLVYYYRASPDRRRILFGGRVSVRETDPRVSAPKLHRELVSLFPQLADAKVSHSWMGYVDFTFDSMPHLGRHDGMYFAMGYCGSGIATASYLGTRVGQQLLGLAEGRTALDQTGFATRPLYFGNPWFLAPSVQCYRFLDRSGR